METIERNHREVIAAIEQGTPRKGRPSETSGGEQTIRLRDAGQPHLLNVSRSTIYELRHDPDFKRQVPIVYVGNVPFVFVSDITKYKEFLRGKAVDRGRPRTGRPRKITPTGKR